MDNCTTDRLLNASSSYNVTFVPSKMFHVKHFWSIDLSSSPFWKRQSAMQLRSLSQSQNVSRETFSRLESYSALLLKWNPKINLVGKTTENELWTRHIEDSLQLLPLLPSTITTMADLGSGAGLPGIIIAIAKPELQVTLVEQDQRKSAFLKEAVRVLELNNVTVEAKDIRTIDSRFELVTARALASLTELCALAYPLLKPQGICLFPKGENFANEVAEAGETWGFHHVTTPSTTNGKSCIVTITELSPKDGKQ